MKKSLLFLSLIITATIFTACSLNAKPEQIPSKPRYDKVQYKMNCYLENIGDGEYSLNRKVSKTYEGKPGEETVASPVDVTGFTIKPFTQETIKNDWSTVVNVYYKRNSYAINFNTAGGNTIAPQSFQYEEKIVLPKNPERKGYSFTGWAPEVPATMPANGLTLTAQWIEGTATPYKVNHYLQNADDNYYTLDFSDDKAGRTNSLTQAVAKKYENYTVQYFEQKPIAADGSTIVYIYYNRNTFTISFDTDGGSAIDDITFKYGQTISVPTPTKDLYLFKEWEPELPATMPAENIEVKAIWHQPEYTITYLDQNGSDFTGTFTATAPNIHKYGTQTTLLSPTRTGYTFDGWFIKGDCSGSSITTLGAIEYTGNITVYAKWIDGVTLSASNLESYLANVTDKTKVYSFKISDSNPTLSDLKTILYNYSDIKIAYDLSECSGLTTVGIDAFINCYNLASIIIPSSVTSIDNSAFYNCSGLTSVTIPSSVTSIHPGTFHNCTDLTSVTIPSSVTSIGYNAFNGCSGLTSVTIPSSVTSIGPYAFYGCSGLTSVTIPSSVTSIDTCPFSGCSGLEQITVDKNNPKYDSRNNCNAIIETATNTLVVGFKDTIIPSSVTSIGSSAFYGCSDLTSVTIPSSVTSIGDYAFGSCSGLTSVTIENGVKSIGTYAFYDCSSLTSVTIPSSVTSIGHYAFYDCSGLTSVIIENGVKLIDSRAFYNCSGLTSVTIPSSVTSIGSYAFYNCSKLNSLTFDDTTTWYRVSSAANRDNKTGGTQTDVSDSATNATNFRNTSGYYNYYWYKL